MNRHGLFWSLLISFLVIDQVSKAWIRGALRPEQSLDGPWPGVFEIKYVINEGIAFGLFQGSAIVLTPVAVIIAVFAAYYSYTHRQESTWTHTAMALLAAGALGNLYDRLFLGGVTDMFWIRAINFPVFNVADVCITVATVILIFKWGMDAIRPHPDEIEAMAMAPHPGAQQTPTSDAELLGWKPTISHESENIGAADEPPRDPEVPTFETRSVDAESSVVVDEESQNDAKGTPER